MTDIRQYAREVEAELDALTAATCDDIDELTTDQIDTLRGLDNLHPVITDDDLARMGRYAADEYLLDIEHTARWFDTGRGVGDAGFNEPETTVLILGIGGPTITITYNYQHGTAELFHSWGTFNGTERTTWHLDADTVHDFIDAYCPHPTEWMN